MDPVSSLILVVAWATSVPDVTAGSPEFYHYYGSSPFIQIKNYYSLDAMESICLQHLKKKKSPYLYTFVRQTCKHALSRSLVRHQRRNSLCANTAANFRTIVTVNAVTSSGEHSPQDANRTNQDLGAAARAGLSYTCLPNHVTSGFPFNRYNLHASLFPFWKTGRPISCHVWSKKLWSLLLSACAISAPT